MSISIFYDLETTDTNPIGQIINFCFAVVDQRFSKVDEFNGTVKISRLQLPTAGAILANRTDVNEHQECAQWGEAEAMRRIFEWIAKTAGNAKKRVPFVGYNSARFDLPFLRTSLIRNGFNPYFEGNLESKDLLLAIRKLILKSKELHELLSCDVAEGERFSISLQNVANKLGVLKGEQTHHSVDDVSVTIDLARVLTSRFGLDVRKFQCYEAGSLDSSCRSGRVFRACFPNVTRGGFENCINTPLTLLDYDHRSALWIDLERYREDRGRDAVRWYNRSGSPFFTDGKEEEAEAWRKLAKDALKEFSQLNLKNFFAKSSCDIEQDIYRLDFDAIEMLNRAIWHGDRNALSHRKDRDAKIILLRHELSTYEWGGAHDRGMQQRLKDYALYRYGGRAKLSKSAVDKEYQEGVYSPDFHPTFNELLDDISEGCEKGDGEQKRLLRSLERFYLESDIYRVAGDELKGVRREKNLS